MSGSWFFAGLNRLGQTLVMMRFQLIDPRLHPCKRLAM
jgi:hypothetical protein